MNKGYYTRKNMFLMGLILALGTDLSHSFTSIFTTPTRTAHATYSPFQQQHHHPHFKGTPASAPLSNPRITLRISSSKTGTDATNDNPFQTTESLIHHLLKQTQHESDGTRLPQEERDAILNTVQRLEEIMTADYQSTPQTGTNPIELTAVPLQGEHQLLYTDTERTPQYIGPIKGSTTQYFMDEHTFQNRLTIGPNSTSFPFPLLQISLQAERTTMDKTRMKIFFRQFIITMLGIVVSKKDIDQKGVWKMVYVGEVNGLDGEKMLLRVMRTPNLYILANEL